MDENLDIIIWTCQHQRGKEDENGHMFIGYAKINEAIQMKIGIISQPPTECNR
jgi:hypothetical protein